MRKLGRVHKELTSKTLKEVDYIHQISIKLLLVHEQNWVNSNLIQKHSLKLAIKERYLLDYMHQWPWTQAFLLHLNMEVRRRSKFVDAKHPREGIHPRNLILGSLTYRLVQHTSLTSYQAPHLQAPHSHSSYESHYDALSCASYAYFHHQIQTGPHAAPSVWTFCVHCYVYGSF